MGDAMAGNGSIFYRHFAVESDDRATLTDTRELTLSFSSEAPVQRFFGKEILLHDDNSVDLRRLRQMGSVLFNHNPDRIIGSVRRANLEDMESGRKRGRATVKFDDDLEGETARGKVAAGSLRGVSVGYLVHKFREVRADEEYQGIKGPAFVATKWEPIEISLTPVPADSSVGVGRMEVRSLDGIEIERSNQTEGDLAMAEDPKAPDVQPEPETITVTNSGGAFVTLTQAVSDEPSARAYHESVKSVMVRAESMGHEYLALATSMVLECKSETEIQAALLAKSAEHIRATPATPPAAPSPTETPATEAARKIEEMSDDEFAGMFSGTLLA